MSAVGIMSCSPLGSVVLTCGCGRSPEPERSITSLRFSFASNIVASWLRFDDTVVSVKRTRLILINGAPGAGKSSIAAALASEIPMMLALDLDTVKHALGQWESDPIASGQRARGIALAMADEHLGAGYDVVIGQYLARVPFIEELEHLAARRGAVFTEFVLDLDPGALAARLAARAVEPDRTEHEVNNRLVGPEDGAELAQSLETLRDLRPNALWIDAGGSLPDTVEQIRGIVLAAGRDTVDREGTPDS